MGKRGRPKHPCLIRHECRPTPVRNPHVRLVTHRGTILAFLIDLSLPFEDNQAEQDLRMAAAALAAVPGRSSTRSPGCFRSLQAAAHFCRKVGYIMTLRQQGFSVLGGLTSVFAGQPLMPRLDA
jgi:transposase